MSEASLGYAGALSIAFVAACGTSGPQSFTGNAWLVNESMTVSCAKGTTTMTYPVTIAFFGTGDDIAYYDRVVHCSPSFVVAGNTATLAAPPTDCSTVIAEELAPIDIAEASITSNGSSFHLVMSGTATVSDGTCAISVDASGVR